ncbi:hypothetical protein ACFSQU_07770 [Massilia sp. GCM10020059]|uniref:Uncharacterized protein n=1 Tax=Massilia agrisoli TaxID=2892444 RepID=A0ABS8IUN8_9BURK|nr:hypothetical protein [Massilia agrisoli]MCC6072332.1 hypothetical protein [Massilia agrisoli]
MPVYVQHEVLGKVNDVFNAEAIWQAPGLALFSRRPLLRDLLERSPREHRGRAATRCFSHVTLALPQDEVDDDRHLTRGARVRDLAQSLAALHQKDFGDLLGDDQVRYDVVGAGSLEPGQVAVRFGHAVYLPAPDEKILYSVSASTDSAIWKPVCPIYPDQRLALVGLDGASASHAVPGWPFGPAGAILLINDGPDAPVEVQVRPKDALDCSFDPLSGYYVIKAANARLFLKVTRVGAPATVAPMEAKPAKAAAVWKARAGDETVSASVRPPESDATYAPVAQQRVSLAALALPRLSRYRETGARTLEVGFDAALGVTASENDSVIRFAVDDADELHAVTAAGRQRIGIPASFTPVDAAPIALHAAPPEMADRYCATVRLAAPLSVPVASGVRFVFGRGAPMLASLRVLDSARFLHRADGIDVASADRIGLSRTAFSFEAAGGGYKIGRLSATQALYHLDEEMHFVAAIGEASADKPYLLPAGHHLVAGHYVLRFDA